VRGVNEARASNEEFVQAATDKAMRDIESWLDAAEEAEVGGEDVGAEAAISSGVSSGERGSLKLQRERLAAASNVTLVTMDKAGALQRGQSVRARTQLADVKAAREVSGLLRSASKSELRELIVATVAASTVVLATSILERVTNADAVVLQSAAAAGISMEAPKAAAATEQLLAKRKAAELARGGGRGSSVVPFALRAALWRVCTCGRGRLRPPAAPVVRAKTALPSSLSLVAATRAAGANKPPGKDAALRGGTTLLAEFLRARSDAGGSRALSLTAIPLEATGAASLGKARNARGSTVLSFANPMRFTYPAQTVTPRRAPLSNDLVSEFNADGPITSTPSATGGSSRKGSDADAYGGARYEQKNSLLAASKRLARESVAAPSGAFMPVKIRSLATHDRDIL
jgi:hypothetical protein